MFVPSFGAQTLFRDSKLSLRECRQPPMMPVIIHQDHLIPEVYLKPNTRTLVSQTYKTLEQPYVDTALL